MKVLYTICLLAVILGQQRSANANFNVFKKFADVDLYPYSERELEQIVYDNSYEFEAQPGFFSRLFKILLPKEKPKPNSYFRHYVIGKNPDEKSRKLLRELHRKQTNLEKKLEKLLQNGRKAFQVRECDYPEYCSQHRSARKLLQALSLEPEIYEVSYWTDYDDSLET